MMTFRPYHDPPLDNAATPAPAYHAGELLSNAHRHTLVEIYYEKKLHSCYKDAVRCFVSLNI